MTRISARLQLAVYALAIVVGALISSFVGIAHAAPDAIVAFDHAAHFPALTSPLAHADPPTPLLVDAWRLGIPQVALLLLVYLGGRAALDNRRWLARRWPRVVGYLDRGKVWNVLSSAITLAGTLTNNGTLSFNSVGNLTDLVISGTQSIAGSGNITLSNTTANRIYGTNATLNLGSGQTLVLENNAEPLTVTTNGSFLFPRAVAGAWAVSIATQPGQGRCVVTRGSGNATADVTDVTDHPTAPDVPTDPTRCATPDACLWIEDAQRDIVGRLSGGLAGTPPPKPSHHTSAPSTRACTCRGTKTQSRFQGSA